MIQQQEFCILGAGIAGLTCALALLQKGANVRVLERAPEITEVGAGLQISPNGVRVFDALGLGDEARKRAMRGQGVWLRDGLTGHGVLDLAYGNVAPNQDFLLFHRADLIDMLLQAVRAQGGEIECNRAISSVQSGPNGATLHNVDGSQETVPFLIGADGLHSVVRSAINGAKKPFFTGQVAWRTIVPATGAEPAEATVFMGPSRHMVTYPLRGGSCINIVAVEERDTWAEEGWNHQDDPANLRRAFSGFCDDAQALLERADQVHVWGLFRHEVAPVWHQNHMCILGDAAHPTLPFMAQGAVMGLEDAWVLADCLEKFGVENGPKTYQNRRHARATKIVAAANANARNYHFANPFARFMGHNMLRFAGNLAPKQVFGRFRWIYDADVTKP